VVRGWLLHLPAMAAVILWIALVADMPLWAYLIAAYAALSILKIRTFLEHQAHERARGRTVIIEDRGPLALMFLNNNLHVVHHMHPKVPWYRLPELYFANREKYLTRNGGYMYRSYARCSGAICSSGRTRCPIRSGGAALEGSREERCPSRTHPGILEGRWKRLGRRLRQAFFTGQVLIPRIE
jgi:hypothetical protein